MMMNETKELLDRQLSRVMWTQGDRHAVRCAIRKERTYMKKKFVWMLAAALLLTLLAGVALAVGMGWGVKEFAQRDAQVRDGMPDVPVQTAIPQQGGVGREALVSVTDAVWDGETVYITLLAEPVQEGLLLMDECLAPDMPVRNLDCELPEGMTIAEWAAGSGFTDMLGLGITPVVNGNSMGCRVRWHMEEDGACTQLFVFEGLAAGEKLELSFLCGTFGYDAETESFSDLTRADGFRLDCTLTKPAVE